MSSNRVRPSIVAMSIVLSATVILSLVIGFVLLVVTHSARVPLLVGGTVVLAGGITVLLSAVRQKGDRRYSPIAIVAAIAGGAMLIMIGLR